MIWLEVACAASSSDTGISGQRARPMYLANMPPPITASAIGPSADSNRLSTSTRRRGPIRTKAFATAAGSDRCRVVGRRRTGTASIPALAARESAR